MSLKQLLLMVTMVTLVLPFALPILGDGPSFHPDATFKGSNLSGWQTLGQAEWRAENGVLTGNSKSGSGGWLILDHPYQDVGLDLDFMCTGNCQSGVLFRMQKSANGTTGVYVPL